MTSPAERYAASRRRSVAQNSALHEFRATKAFPLDDFQVVACKSLETGRGVLVAAPTGAGKTVVGEFAVFLALRQGGKAFYTTPIKALSNQKFREFIDTHGEANVGLLTGDISINSEAPIVVMTTEVLRNMLYAGSDTLNGLMHVVMDEVHYLADRDRGAVWEEVILQLPESVTVTALSATVSNAEEFGDWLQAVRGDTDVIVEELRPVPLWQHVAANGRIIDLFADDETLDVNPELVRLGREQARWERSDDRRPKHQRHSRATPSRIDVIEQLDRVDLLPAITFIFSRAGCDAAVRQCLHGGVRLTTPQERRIIRDFAEQRTSDLPGDDLNALGYDEWLAALERGIAAHHAGLIPRFKEIIEDLFQRGYLKAIFATETLALGINMPARCVVLERLTKWNGETHAEITPGEYTQLTGRAGRRGIDDEGHAVVVWHNGLDPRALAGLASTRTYPLRSSFRPAYTMAVNLVNTIGFTAARKVLEASFAQFQADRAVVGLVRQAQKNEEALAGYRDAMACHLGDFEEYAALRRTINEVEKQAVRRSNAQARIDAANSLAALNVGDVIIASQGRRPAYAVVLDKGTRHGMDNRPSIMGVDRQVRRVSATEFDGTIEVRTTVRLPKDADARKPHVRKQIAQILRDATAELGNATKSRRTREIADVDALRREMKAHPCHGCNDREDHARWGERYFRLEGETRLLRDRIEHRTNSIAREFDKVCRVLVELEYLQGDAESLEITEQGRTLAALHTELDLLVAEAMRRGLLDDLTPPEFVAVASVLVHESRREGEAPRIPSGRATTAIEAITELWLELTSIEAAVGATQLREPDAAFAWSSYRWASGARLSTVLRDNDISAGDFIRWMRRLIDLIEQIGAADRRFDDVAHRAVGLLKRGIVASIDIEE